MLTLITILHLFVAVLLIVLVLVQDSKGDGMGTTFGGGNSGSVLGATGAVSFLGKATRIVVVIFAATAIILTRMTAADQGSVLDRVSGTTGETPPATVPATTTGAAAGAAAAPPQPVTGPAAGSVPGSSTPGTQKTSVPVATPAADAKVPSPTPADPKKQ